MSHTVSLLYLMHRYLCVCVQDKDIVGQQLKAEGGAAVDVLNKAINSEGLSTTSGVKSDSHSTHQAETKTDSQSQSEVVEGQQVDSTAAVTGVERNVAKEADEHVKSKTLSLKEDDSSDKHPDSTSASQWSVPKEAIPSIQDSGAVLTQDLGRITAEQEAPVELNLVTEPAPKCTSGAVTKIEPKIESTPAQENENHRSPHQEPVVSGKQNLAADSSTKGPTVVSSPPHLTTDTTREKIQVNTEGIHDHGKLQERRAVPSSQVESVVHEASLTPSAPPALIDFTETSQAADIQTVSSTASAVASATEDGSRILYPRLDSIMRGIVSFAYHVPYTCKRLYAVGSL